MHFIEEFSRTHKENRADEGLTEARTDSQTLQVQPRIKQVLSSPKTGDSGTSNSFQNRPKMMETQRTEGNDSPAKFGSPRDTEHPCSCHHQSTQLVLLPDHKMGKPS